MKGFTVIGIALMTVFILGSCSGPKKSVEEEKVLSSLSNIQQSLENDISYEQFIDLVSQAKIEIDGLKSNGKNSQCFMGAVDKCYAYYGKNSQCFMGAVDKCYAYYTTGGRAWQQKLTASNEHRKLEMDLTFSVLQSRAALSIQMADNCFKK
jgi:hypothetical protein